MNAKDFLLQVIGTGDAIVDGATLTDEQRKQAANERRMFRDEPAPGEPAVTWVRLKGAK